MTYITKQAKYQMNRVWEVGTGATLGPLNDFARVLRIEAVPSPER